jgi:hypothetical protein
VFCLVPIRKENNFPTLLLENICNSDATFFIGVRYALLILLGARPFKELI